MDDLVPMLLSLLFGTVVGWERQIGRKPAGLRTHTLVCLGSTLFVLLGRHAQQLSPSQTYDPTRIIHGVVTGVGFLGAGAIIRHEGMTHGLTTAASIWMASAIGVAVGVRAYALAAISTGFALIVLEVFRWMERAMAPKGGPRDPAPEG